MYYIYERFEMIVQQQRTDKVTLVRTMKYTYDTLHFGIQH
mgnify:FL=1